MQTTTNQPQKVKFAAQSDPTALEALRRMARAEGRQLQALIDEALRDYIERKQGLTLRKHMLAAFQASMSQYDSLYRKLAQ